MPHRQATDKVHAIPTCSVDYFFMGVDDEASLPLLAFRDHGTRVTMAYPMLAKGVNEY